MKNPNQLKKLTPEIILEIKRLRREGFGIRYIASLFGINVTTAKWHIGDVKPPYEIVGNYLYDLSPYSSVHL